MWSSGCHKKPYICCKLSRNISNTHTPSTLTHTHTHKRMINQRGQRSEEASGGGFLKKGSQCSRDREGANVKTQHVLERSDEFPPLRSRSRSLDRLSVSRQQLSVERKNLERALRHGMHVCKCVCECVKAW